METRVEHIFVLVTVSGSRYDLGQDTDGRWYWRREVTGERTLEQSVLGTLDRSVWRELGKLAVVDAGVPDMGVQIDLAHADAEIPVGHQVLFFSVVYSAVGDIILQQSQTSPIVEIHRLSDEIIESRDEGGRLMESFEQFVALAMESDGFVVSGALKFDVRRRTSKAAYEEWQTHGFEVDLVGARGDRLILATVKSFFGSRGVTVDDVSGTGKNAKWYALLNQLDVRDTVVAKACERFGYAPEQVEMRLYVGRFAGGAHEVGVRAWAAEQHVGSGPIHVIGAGPVVATVREMAVSKQYRDHPVLATLKVLAAADKHSGSSSS